MKKRPYPSKAKITKPHNRLNKRYHHLSLKYFIHRCGSLTKSLLDNLRSHLRQNWLGLAVILIATFVFFWPIVTRIGTYSSGGDAMFNAWTLARNHNCIQREGCPNYSDANIYFPHSDTMLYSETQLSAGFLTLPLHWIDKNPIFAFNVWTIASFFFSGWFMYLLAKYLSRGNELFSIVAGLIFEFAPFKMAAIFHLQNLSIFYLPLALLLILKYFDNQHRKYLALLLTTLILLFHASWYQMFFALIALGVLLSFAGLLKLVRWHPVGAVSTIVILAIMTTLPLAKEYIRFSKQSEATFNISDQLLYASSLKDYVIPHQDTPVGKLYYKANPETQRNSFNLDSYSYHSLTLYVLAPIVVLIFYQRHRRNKQDKVLVKDHKKLFIFTIIGLVGFILSLGPLLKIEGNYLYSTGPGSDLKFVIPLPHGVLVTLLPQLLFIRAIGRASVLLLIALCCVLAYFALVVEQSKLRQNYKLAIKGLVLMLLIFELFPLRQIPMKNSPYNYNLKIPAVYRFIKSDPTIDNIIILSSDYDYPNTQLIARAEQVLWAGYHNRNIFNGYSGYTPPTYFKDYEDFINFAPDDIAKMKKLGIKYVVVDKLLSRSKPQLAGNVSKALPNMLYEDQRYVLHKID